MKCNVAIIQDSPVLFDKAKTLQKFGALTYEAAHRGADIVVFPEAFISAYPKGMDFGVVIGHRPENSFDWYNLYHQSSIDLNSNELDDICNVAKKNNIFIVLGLIEKHGGTLYCSVIYIDKEGNYKGKHRKLMPTAMERLVWGCGDGTTMKVVASEYGKIGAAICWENYMPQLRIHYYEQLIDIYCTPTVDDREVWQSTIRHIAKEGRCFVVSACQFMTKEDCPSNYPISNNYTVDNIYINGGSCIINPFGNYVVSPKYGKKDILLAEIDLGMITKAKFDFDIAGHYSRKDIFNMKVRSCPEIS